MNTTDARNNAARDHARVGTFDVQADVAAALRRAAAAHGENEKRTGEADPN